MSDAVIHRTSRKLFFLRIVAGTFAILGGVLLLSSYIKNSFPWSLMVVEAGEGVCIPHRIVLLHKSHPKNIQRGEIIAFRPKPGKMKAFEDKKNIQNFVVAKYVGGIEGDVMEVKNDSVSIAGRNFGELDLLETLKKKSGSFDRVAVVGKNQYAMFGTEKRSYDARYWGFIDDSEIIGRAYPLW